MGMEPQSTLSGFSVQTNRASCVFVRQKVFCQTKPTCPPSQSEDFPPKSENLTKGVKDNSNVEKQNNNSRMMDYQMRRQVKGSFLSIININRKMSRTKI